jgi:hypothetical protein
VHDEAVDWVSGQHRVVVDTYTDSCSQNAPGYRNYGPTTGWANGDKTVLFSVNGPPPASTSSTHASSASRQSNDGRAGNLQPATVVSLDPDIAPPAVAGNGGPVTYAYGQRVVHCQPHHPHQDAAVKRRRRHSLVLTGRQIPAVDLRQRHPPGQPSRPQHHHADRARRLFPQLGLVS